MIIDCHAHLLPAWRMRKLIEWTLRFSPAHPIPTSVTLDDLLAEYARERIALVWNFAHAIFPEETNRLNEWNRDLGRDHPQIVPFGTCHPEAPDPVAVVDRCLDEYGFVGMKFHPFVQKFTPWEARFFPVYEAIAARRRIVVFHTGFEKFYGGALPLSGFEAIVRAFPELTVVFAHANYPHVGEAFDMMARYPNVYVDTVHVFARISESWGGAPDSPWSPGDRLTPWDELREGLRAFPDRVMFGTDHPSGTGTLADIYRQVRAFALEPDVERALSGENALSLLKRAGWRPADS